MAQHAPVAPVKAPAKKTMGVLRLRCKGKHLSGVK